MSILGTIAKIGGKLLFGKVAKASGESESVVEKVLSSAGEVIQTNKTLRGIELEITRNFFGIPKDAHLVIQILQSSVRPVVTYVWTWLMAHHFYYGITIDPQMFYIGSGVILAWFVPRPFEKVGKFKKVAKLLMKGGK